MNRRLRDMITGKIKLSFLNTLASAEVLEGALCDEETAELFFSENPREVAQARQICMQCPVRVKCLEYGLTFQNEGILGGHTESERLKMSKGKQLDLSLVNQATEMRRDLFGISPSEFAKRYCMSERTVMRLRKDCVDPESAA